MFWVLDVRPSQYSESGGLNSCRNSSADGREAAQPIFREQEAPLFAATLRRVNVNEL